LKDDDEVIAVWYLMGWLHTLTNDADSARFYLEQALTVSIDRSIRKFINIFIYI